MPNWRSSQGLDDLLLAWVMRSVDLQVTSCLDQHGPRTLLFHPLPLRSKFASCKPGWVFHHPYEIGTDSLVTHSHTIWFVVIISARSSHLFQAKVKKMDNLLRAHHLLVKTRCVFLFQGQSTSKDTQSCNNSDSEGWITTNIVKYPKKGKKLTQLEFN